MPATKSPKKKKNMKCPISEISELKVEKGLGKSAITRNAAEDLQIPIYQAQKHQMPTGDFFVDFTDGYVKKKKPKKKVNDPIGAAMKYRAGDQTAQAFKNDSPENQEKILSKIKLEPHQ